LRAEIAAATTLISGPPGSGKTSALAKAANRQAANGKVAAICSHPSSCASFSEMLGASAKHDVVVDTLDGHLARWMRERSTASGAAIDLTVGSAADGLLRDAARDVLDMSWPGFVADKVDLGAPMLARPDVLLREAADLFRQLRQANVSPDEFERGCAGGQIEFYGERVEKAQALCADATVRARASRRGRESLCAGRAGLLEQREAERSLSALLAHLYRSYRSAVREARVIPPEDLVDEALSWLSRDERACRSIAGELSGIVLDDAEDAFPGSAALLELLGRSGGACEIAAAGWAPNAIDGMSGRRSALDGPFRERIDLTPRVEPAGGIEAVRVRDEREEADWIAASVRDLLAGGAAPSSIMLLARDGDAAAVYSKLLRAREIPIAAPPGHWQQPDEIADLLALAAIVDDPGDEAHLLRVLASPLVGLNDLSLWTLCKDPDSSTQLLLDVGAVDVRGAPRRAGTERLASNALTGAADARLSEPGRIALSAFRERWQQWQGATKRMTPAALLAFVAEAAGFRAKWRQAPQWRRERLDEDALRLIAAAAPYPSAKHAIAAIEEQRSMPSLAAPPALALDCRTIIGAKGVRKPYVFVAGVAHERFPRIYVSRALAFSRRFGLIVKENAGRGAANTAKFAWYYAKFEAKRKYVDEAVRALEYGLRRACVRAYATGFGKPPRWAADQDLLARYGA
jgi:hypothetical protein